VTVNDQKEIVRLGQASEWLVRLRNEPDSEEQLIAWLHWRDQDPANVEAFRRIQALWGQFDKAYPTPAEINALLGASGRRRRKTGSRGSALKSLLRLFLSDSRFRWAIVAMCTFVIGAAAFWGWGINEKAVSLAAPTGTAHRTVTLPDGSFVDLGPKTTMTVDFRRGQRRLQLYPGEAYFKVRSDRQRPFVVRAGTLNVTAVGTAFDVKHELDRVTVTVQEGVVAVEAEVPERTQTSNASSSNASWRVTSGYQLIYFTANAATTLSSVDAAATIAWREGRLEYLNAPLASVVADINRYSDRPIVFLDSSVAELTFTGTVFTDSIDAWLQSLPAALPVRVIREPRGVSLAAVSNAATQ
jgi:transmembrane sensor